MKTHFAANVLLVDVNNALGTMVMFVVHLSTSFLYDGVNDGFVLFTSIEIVSRRKASFFVRVFF